MIVDLLCELIHIFFMYVGIIFVTYRVGLFLRRFRSE